jgi:hypothetical protein
MSSERDVTRVVRSWMQEDEHESADRVLDAVLDQLDTTPQRRAGWPAWRTPIMNKFVAIGLGAAAVVVALFVGAQLLGSPSNTGGGLDATVTPESTLAPTPSPSAWTGIPEGPFVVTNTDLPVQTTVSIAASGWSPLEGLDAITKDDDGLDPPESVGAAFLAWAWPAGSGFDIYGDPCRWSTTIPETPATTPGEIAAALAAQASSNATAPVDVTVGGYAGKAITVHVPMAFELGPDSTREEEFADCDEDVFGFYGVRGEPEPARNAQGPGQIDELWILEVDGAIVILDAAYSPSTPADLVEEMRAMAASATFGE